jgi:drug/metabolite transporter (DMT)-like permease
MSASTSQFLPLALYSVAAVIGAGGQWLYKQGAAQLGEVPLFRNVHLFGGMAAFCLVMVLFVAGFRLGGRLSVVYPMYATTFVWGALIAARVEHEAIGPLQWLAIGIIVAGVVLLTAAAPR